MFRNRTEISLLLRSPLERLRFLHAASRRLWPTLRRLGTFYRLTLVRNTRIVAVVGSFGKSTTMRAVTVALGRKLHPWALFNAYSDVAAAMLRIRPGDRHAVLEVGIGIPGQMTRYAQLIRPNITVVTSIGSEHRRGLKTLEVTRSEKAEMVRILSSSGLAVLNGDDPNVLWMRNQTRARVITFGFCNSNDIRASDVILEWPSGMRFTLHAAKQRRTVHTRLIGKHMAYPILAAVAVALAEGFTLDRILPALEALPATPGRMEAIRLPNGAFILRDDYKSHVETMEAALDALSKIPAQRRIAVLGEVDEPPGSQGPIYRRLGERVGYCASRAIFVGGSGAWSPFASGVKNGGLSPDKLVNAGRSVLQAANTLRHEIAAGDVVLIKGRGSQRLDRITLALMGRTVRCDISYCNASIRCAQCPMLKR